MFERYPRMRSFDKHHWIVALPAPTEREKSQLYTQRYLPLFPAAGEVVIFDRSWYNQAGVEHVMGFCTDAEYEGFLRDCPEFEHYFVEQGIILIKYWFDVGMDEQERRFRSRIVDPRKIWKLSPMDLESYMRWYGYSKAHLCVSFDLPLLFLHPAAKHTPASPITSHRAFILKIEVVPPITLGGLEA